MMTRGAPVQLAILVQREFENDSFIWRVRCGETEAVSVGMSSAIVDAVEGEMHRLAQVAQEPKP